MSALVTHFEIYANEPRKLATFYKELFGWDVVKAIGTDYFYIRMMPPQTELRGGVMFRPVDAPKSWVSYVRVESIDDTLGRVRALGGRVIRDKQALPQKAWSAVLEDPEGNIFVVYELNSAASDLLVTEAVAQGV